MPQSFSALLAQASVKQPLIIAGPCSAETPQQLLSTAKALQAYGVKAFRAGLWKPRTYPEDFQGIGAEGLQWLVQVRNQTGMLIGTEVGSAEHVRQLLTIKPDFVWIGARTALDPFALDEIGAALQGTPITVLVKNPPIPDVHAWIGAIRRIQSHNINHVGAILRGTSPTLPTVYRNMPAWELAEALSQVLPNVPILIDPSHIAGRSALVAGVASEAIQRGFTGLMVEVHENPEQAQSDAKQQITPHSFATLLNQLSQKPDAQLALKLLRQEIDHTDQQILRLIHQRAQLSAQIAHWKKEHAAPTFQPNRYEEALAHRLAWAQELDLPATLIHNLYELLHDHSIQIQQLLTSPDHDH